MIVPVGRGDRKLASVHAVALLPETSIDCGAPVVAVMIAMTLSLSRLSVRAAPVSVIRKALCLIAVPEYIAPPGHDPAATVEGERPGRVALHDGTGVEYGQLRAARLCPRTGRSGVAQPVLDRTVPCALLVMLCPATVMYPSVDAPG